MASDQPVSGWRGLPPLPSAHRPIRHAGASRHFGGLPRTPAAKARRARGLPLATQGDRSPAPGGADDAQVAPPRWLVLGSRGRAGGTPAVHRSISPVAVTAEPRDADASYAGFDGTDVAPTPRRSSVAVAAAGALALGLPSDAAFALEHKALEFGRDGGPGASASLDTPHLPRPGSVARSVREDAAARSKMWSPTTAAAVSAGPAESTLDTSTTRASAVPAMTPRPGSLAVAARTGQSAGSAMRREMDRAASSSPGSDVAAVPAVRPTPSSNSPAEPPRSSIRGDRDRDRTGRSVHSPNQRAYSYVGTARRLRIHRERRGGPAHGAPQPGVRRRGEHTRPASRRRPATPSAFHWLGPTLRRFGLGAPRPPGFAPKPGSRRPRYGAPQADPAPGVRGPTIVRRRTTTGHL